MSRRANMRRILAFVLALVMAIPLFASPVLASEPTGDYLFQNGSAENAATEDWGTQSQDFSENPSENFVLPDGVQAVPFLSGSDSTVYSASQATQRPGRAEEIFLRRQGNNFEEFDAIIQTLGEPIGMTGFEGEYSLGADRDVVEIAVQFSTPPAVALEILAEAQHPFARGMDTTNFASFESYALSAHERFQEQLFGLQRSSRSLGNMVIIDEFHSLYNGVFMSVPAGMVEHIASLPEVFAVTPNITYYAIGILENMQQETEEDIEDDNDLEEDENNDPTLTDEDEDEDENNDSTLTLADLASVITLAQEILALVEISTDGLDIEEGVMWTTEEAFEALNQAVENAIMAYIALYDAEELIEELLFNAITDLQNALDEFLALMGTGEAVTLGAGINNANFEDDFDSTELFMREALAALDIENVRSTFGVTGDKVRVAVLDTGIDYNHPVFEPYRLQGGGFRGWDAVDEDEDPMETTPWDDDPRPTTHGTHVSGTIAAIAPDIEMSHYRVLGPGGSSPSNVILKGIEKAHDDKVDVMNLSLGASINLPYGPNTSALNVAALDGIVVVIAAGNTGPNAFTVGTPGVTSLAITVGMAQKGGFGDFDMSDVLVDGTALSMRLRGWPFSFDAENSGMAGEQSYYSFGAIAGVPELTESRFEAYVEAIKKERFDGGDLTDTIAVFFRGGTTFVSMRDLAQALNASAVVIVDSQPFNPGFATFLDGHRGANRIPVFWVDNTSVNTNMSLRFKPDRGRGVIDFGEDVGIKYIPLMDIMNPGSSRGPVLGTHHIKPDIVAPGTRIMSTIPAFDANPGLPFEGWTNEENYRYAFVLNSGTSMASPAIAGVAALLLEQYPNATPAEVKARIMNTARPLEDGEYGVYDVGAGYVVPFDALGATYYATVDHPVPWLTNDERGLEMQTMSSLSFGDFGVADLTVGGDTEALTVVIHNGADNSWSPEVLFNDNHSGVDLKVIPGAVAGTFEVSMTFQPDTPAGFYQGNVIFEKDSHKITMPFAVHYYEASEQITMRDGSGIWRPIISNFVLSDVDEDDPRAYPVKIIGALTPSNWSTAIFGFDTTTAPTAPREVEFYAVKNFDGKNDPVEESKENIFVLGSFNIRPNEAFAFADSVSAVMGGRLLSEGVYTFYACVYDLGDTVEFDLGKFVVTSERPSFTLDNNGAFTFGSDDWGVRFTGEVKSWGHDMAIYHGIRSAAYIDMHTNENVLFDYRWAGYSLSFGILRPRSDGIIDVEASPDPGSFVGPAEFEGFAVDAFAHTFVMGSTGWALSSSVASNASVYKKFTHEYVGPAEVPDVSPEKLSANVIRLVDEIVMMEGTPASAFDSRLVDINLEIVPNAGVFARSLAPAIRVEWTKDGEFFASADSFMSQILANWGVYPNDPDRLVGRNIEMYFPTSRFGSTMNRSHAGEYAMKVYAGDILLGESEPIVITIEPFELKPGAIELKHEWTMNEITFMQGSPQGSFRYPVDVTVTLSEDSDLHAETFLSAIWIRTSDGREWLPQSLTLGQLGIDPSDPEKLTNTTPWSPRFGNPMFGVGALDNGEWRLHISISGVPLSVSEEALVVNIFPDPGFDHLTVNLTTLHPVANMREWQFPVPEEIAPIRVDIDFGEKPSITNLGPDTMVTFLWTCLESGRQFDDAVSLRDLGIDLSNENTLSATHDPVNAAFNDAGGNVTRWGEGSYTLRVEIGGRTYATSDVVEVNVEHLPPGSVEFNYINFPRFTNVPLTQNRPLIYEIEFETELDWDRLQFMWMKDDRPYSNSIRGSNLSSNRITLSLDQSWQAGVYYLVAWAYGEDDKGNINLYDLITADMSHTSTLAPNAKLCDCGCPICPVINCTCDGDCPPPCCEKYPDCTPCEKCDVDCDSNCDPNSHGDPPPPPPPPVDPWWPPSPPPPPGVGQSKQPDTETEKDETEKVEPEVPIVPTPEEVFNDVKPGDWFHDYITIAVTQGLFRGTAYRTFSPNTGMTRAMFVQVLANMAKDDQFVTTGETTFADVPTAAWFFEAVEWATKSGLVQGIDELNFAPDAPVTREQMAVMLYRFLQLNEIELPTASAQTTFTDQNSVSDWARDAVNALTAAGIFTGRPDGSFDPLNTATRAEVAAVFVRLIGIMQ